MVDEDVLCDFGLTLNEAKIYLSLLSLGFTNVSSISERTKLHRTNVYDVLKKLVDKGLVSFIKQDNITFFEASDPSVLLSLLKEKESKLKELVPKLALRKKLSENSSEIVLFKGVSAFLDCLFNLLDLEQEFLVLGMPERAIKLLGARVFPFHKSRIDRGISLKQVYSINLKKRVKSSFGDFTKTKFAGQDFNVSCVISGDELLLTDWQEEVVTLKIKNNALVEYHKSQFFVVWDNSTV